MNRFDRFDRFDATSGSVNLASHTNLSATSTLMDENSNMLLQLNAPPLVQDSCRDIVSDKSIPLASNAAKSKIDVTKMSRNRFLFQADYESNSKKETSLPDGKSRLKPRLIVNNAKAIESNLPELKKDYRNNDRWGEISPRSAKINESNIRGCKHSSQVYTERMLELCNTENELLKYQLDDVKAQINQLHDVVSKLQEESFFGKFNNSNTSSSRSRNTGSSYVSSKKSINRRQKTNTRVENSCEKEEGYRCINETFGSQRWQEKSSSNGIYARHEDSFTRTHVQEFSLSNNRADQRKSVRRLPVLRPTIPHEIDFHGGSQHTIGAITTTPCSSWRGSDYSGSDDEGDLDENEVGPEAKTPVAANRGFLTNFSHLGRFYTGLVPGHNGRTQPTGADFIESVHGKVVYIDNINLPSLSRCSKTTGTSTTNPSTSSLGTSQNTESFDLDAISVQDSVTISSTVVGCKSFIPDDVKTCETLDVTSMQNTASKEDPCPSIRT